MNKLRHNRIVAVLVSVLVAVTPATTLSQGTGIVGLIADAGYSQVDSVGGFGLSLGVAWTPGRLQLGASGELIFQPTAGDSRYYRDYFSNGQSRCRDSQTGQFASDSKCGGSVSAVPGAMAEMTFRFGKSVLVGGGYRVGEPGVNGPVGVVGYTNVFTKFPARFHVRGVAGENYFSARFGIVMRRRG